MKISYLRDEMNRLEGELTRDKHSTPLVERHVNPRYLADHSFFNILFKHRI